MEVSKEDLFHAYTSTWESVQWNIIQRLMARYILPETIWKSVIREAV